MSKTQLSKGSVDADRKLMAKARTCTEIRGIEPTPDGNIRTFKRSEYQNDRQWHSLYVYCWQNRDEFEFSYTGEGGRQLTSREAEKLGITITDDEHIMMKHKKYTEDELKENRVKGLREICTAKGIPDDGDKRDMINAILAHQEAIEAEE